MTTHLPRKVAVVTGAGSGIGKAVALALAGAGHDLVLAGRRTALLDEVAAQIRQAQGEVAQTLCVPTDVADAQQVRALFDQTVARFGRVDLLFNNAGRSNPPGDFVEWSAEDWQNVVDVNLNGMFYCLQQAFRVMRAQQPRGGRIINNGSISAHAPRPNAMAYTATKHAVSGLTRAGALDGRAYDIAVGQIDVGNAYTDMAARMTRGVPQADGRIEIEPTMDVQIVADSVVYMAGLPLAANVLFHTVMATKMPFVGRG